MLRVSELPVTRWPPGADTYFDCLCRECAGLTFVHYNIGLACPCHVFLDPLLTGAQHGRRLSLASSADENLAFIMRPTLTEN
ncbi:hypothetical protein F2P79_007502 [Pimephales promelas]|nr:hypothetical protein F2P79_007502 [Pimephales promelas]